MAFLPLIIEADREHRERIEDDEREDRKRAREREDRYELRREGRQNSDFHRAFYDEPDPAPQTYYEPGMWWLGRILLGVGAFFGGLFFLAWILGAL